LETQVISTGAADIADIPYDIGDWDTFSQAIAALENYVTADYLNLAAVTFSHLL
jgi:hypothetical protein